MNPPRLVPPPGPASDFDIMKALAAFRPPPPMSMPGMGMGMPQASGGGSGMDSIANGLGSFGKSAPQIASLFGGSKGGVDPGLADWGAAQNPFGIGVNGGSGLTDASGTGGLDDASLSMLGSGGGGGDFLSWLGGLFGSGGGGGAGSLFSAL